MIVSCPACESRFEVDQEQLGYKGRIVRCGKCGNCWHQMPDDDPRVAVAVAEEPGPPPRRRPMPPPKKKGRGVAVGWLLLLLLIAGIAAGGWFERERIVAQFPQLADAYALLGVPVTGPGPVLDLKVLSPTSDVVEGDTVITVRGTVTNISDRKQDVPRLRAQLVNGTGEVLTEWVFETPQPALDAGGSVDFVTQTRNPPAEAQNVSVFFVESAR
ncbi:DUF3426 domain-containing protein [Pelagibius sp. CAU 1746]|uniref:DUF3426 domain-containing protein n=1 Tax=Pelagibius sp. CAU 1746 TaxID=3140370 RepID=UPI00325A9113